MIKVLRTNTLTAFTRSASLTIPDFKEKVKPTALLDKVYLCLAQVMLEENVKSSVTKTKQFHITEDIKINREYLMKILDKPNPKIPEKHYKDITKWTIRLLNYGIEDVYTELTSQTPNVVQEIAYRKKLAIGQSKQGNASAIQNFFNSKAHISYRKGYN